MIYIENAYENVKQYCETALKELFPVGIPSFAQERFEDEIKYLGEIGDVSDFELHRLLCIEAKKTLQYMLSGYYDTNFFLLYLMNQSLGNPLPAHYYCTNCGYYEVPDTHKFGIDLPEKCCPKCGNKLRRDGFDLLVEFSMAVNRRRIPAFQCKSNTEFLPTAYRVLQRTYPENKVVPRGTFEYDNKTNKQKMRCTGFYILPKGKDIKDFIEYQSFFEDGTPCLSEGYHDVEELHYGRVEIVPNKIFDDLVNLQRKTGVYLGEITLDDIAPVTWNNLRNIFVLDEAEVDLLEEAKPDTIHAVTAIHSFVNNKYVNCDIPEKGCFSRDYIDFFKSDIFQKYSCFTREDIFEQLQKYGIDKEYSYMIVQRMRQGAFINPNPQQRYTMKCVEILDNIPKELQEISKITKNVVSRGEMVMEVLLYLLLVFYMQEDNKTYGKIVCRRE